MTRYEEIEVVDSHTGGEPTRVVVSGGFETGSQSPRDLAQRFARDHDHFRRALVNEPRGSDVIVGAWLCPAIAEHCTAGVVFFNNVGYLGMCVHGTIGVMETLRFLNRIDPGTHCLETPVGDVHAKLHQDGRVSVENVVSYRTQAQIALTLSDGRTVHGDVAWGGNWFFLVNDHQETLDLARAHELTALAWDIRQQLNRQRVCGTDGSEIDHIELFGPASDDRADSRNFVLCPGQAYDRSPCGTGTSAKLACLWSDGQLAEGQVWRQESIVGSVFEGSVRAEGEGVRPTITGRAHITARATMILDSEDPYRMGFNA